MLKILILGSSGTLGKQIYKELKKINKIELFHTGLKKRKIDFTNKTEFKKFIFSINPDLIINCIAYTNVDKCENYKSLSKKINFEIVKEIFKLKVKKKLKFNFIHFSTDQFYNQIGKKPSNETSKIFLFNNYCKHKRMAELECIKINSDKVLKVKRSKNMYMSVKKFEKKFQFKLPNIQSEIRSEVKNYTISRK